MTNPEDPIVTTDLRALSELQLPPKGLDPAGRHIVKVTILMLVVCVLACMASLTYALVASLDRENSLKTEIGCVRSSAVQVDRSLGKGVSALIDNDNTILGALYGVAINDPDLLTENLENVQTLVDNGEVAQASLDTAIEAREEALLMC